jgi:hypothetical protein
MLACFEANVSALIVSRPIKGRRSLIAAKQIVTIFNFDFVSCAIASQGNRA